MDRKIVEESYLVFSPSLYLYALSLTKDERKAEQLVSEAYYKLLCQTQAPDQLKFWLLRVVKTSFIDQYRKKQYRQSVDLATQQITFTESFERKGSQIPITDEDVADLAKGTVDYIGFSYYMSNTVDSTKQGDANQVFNGGSSYSVKNPYIEESDWGWAIDPEGLRYALNAFYERYEKPLFIVENGFGAIDVKNEDNTIHDDYRIAYLASHIKEMEKPLKLTVQN